ncbi:MAG: sensor histidine kinase, partial [Gemmatimonadaceae bacterium]
GVTNVIRHSAAHMCTIRVARDESAMQVAVIDDGRGSRAPGADDTGETAIDGNGLRGLAERVAALGGRFEAGPVDGGGFHLVVSAPLAQPTRDEDANHANNTSANNANVQNTIAASQA